MITLEMRNKCVKINCSIFTRNRTHLLLCYPANGVTEESPAITAHTATTAHTDFVTFHSPIPTESVSDHRMLLL